MIAEITLKSDNGTFQAFNIKDLNSISVSSDGEFLRINTIDDGVREFKGDEIATFILANSSV